jgi:hypothetical protein
MNHIKSWDNTVGYNASHTHRPASGFEAQYTAYNKGFGIHCEVLTVRRYEGKVGTYVMVWANVAPNVEGTTGSAYCRMFSGKHATQEAMEVAGFVFAKDITTRMGTEEEKALVAEAAAAMGYPDCHIFVASH